MSDMNVYTEENILLDSLGAGRELKTILTCPTCKDTFSYLHPKEISFPATKEIECDGKRTRAVVSVRTDDRILLDFYCENCGIDVVHTLALEHHKGQTYIGWAK